MHVSAANGGGCTVRPGSARAAGAIFGVNARETPSIRHIGRMIPAALGASASATWLAVSASKASNCAK